MVNSSIVPVSVVVCGVIGLVILCSAILRIAVLERRRHLGRQRLELSVRPTVQGPAAGTTLAA